MEIWTVVNYFQDSKLKVEEPTIVEKTKIVEDLSKILSLY